MNLSLSKEKGLDGHRQRMGETIVLSWALYDKKGREAGDTDMKIERVDDKTVRCFLSNEELEEYEIDYKDFIMRSDKAKQLVQEILHQAVEQVGYKPPRFAFDMQIMLLQDQGLLLTFSESDSNNIPNIQQIMEYLKGVKQILQESQGQLSGGEAAMMEPAVSSVEKPAKKPENAIFVFDRIGQIMSYAATVPTTLRVHTELYEMDGKYYLYMRKGRAAYDRYSRACINALEFGQLYGAEELQIRNLQEHGSCLIAGRALQKLRG